MHEMGFCEGVLKAAQRRAAGRRVQRLRVHIGVLHRVVPEAFQQAFAIAARGTEAEDAVLDLVFIPARLICLSCHHETDCDEPPLVCAICGGVNLELTGGDEIVLESLEYETTGREEKCARE